MKYLLTTLLIAFTLTACTTSVQNEHLEEIEIQTIRSIPNQSWVKVTKSVNGTILKKDDKLFVFGAELKAGSTYHVELELLNNWQLRSIKSID